jgi:hypothetical protein
MHTDIRAYIRQLAPAHRAIAELLAREMDGGLPGAESKVWLAR